MEALGVMQHRKRVSDLTEKFNVIKDHFGTFGIAEHFGYTAEYSRYPQRNHQTKDPLKSLTRGTQPSSELREEVIGLTGFLCWRSLSVDTPDPGTVYAPLKQI